jgi:SAM-dependent methyltransferase
VRQFFEERFDVFSEAELKKHLQKIRHQAWQLAPYPCVGQWWFLRSIIALSPYYPEIIELARDGASIADLACGFGQELRRLRDDGAMGEMYAVDVLEEMWCLGWQLFRDEEPPATFLEADLVDGPQTGLEPLAGKVDIFMLNGFLFLCNQECQNKVLCKIMRASKLGTKIAGWTLVTEAEEGQEFDPTYPYHTIDTFKLMWRDLHSMAGTRWSLECQPVKSDDMGFETDDWAWNYCRSEPKRGLFFIATRLR